MNYILSLIEPDFLQELLIAAFAFILPLEKKPHWLSRFILTSFFSVLFVGIITHLSSTNDSYKDFSNYFATHTLIEYIPYSILQLSIVLFLPLVLCFAIIKFTTKLKLVDSLYCLSCVYVVQHIGFMFLSGIFGENFSNPRIIALHYVIYIPLIILVYYFFAKHITTDGHYHVSGSHTLISFLFIFLMAMVLNMYFRFQQITDAKTVFIICSYDIFACIFILWIQASQRKEVELQAEILIEKQLFQKNEAQYTSAKENIEIINQKCHDLKYQIAALRDMPDEKNRWNYINEIEAAVSIYDATIKTGNTALDTIFTEKSLLCEKNNIDFTCLADGIILQKVNAVDLYSLFGNALDNAIEACTKTTSISPAISLTIKKSGMYALIDIENTSDIIPDFENNLPKTSKGDLVNHGFGTKSIHSIVQKYNGTMRIYTKQNTYRLAIAIPIDN